MIVDIVKNSQNQPNISMSAEIHEAMMELRDFMFKNVYTSSIAKAEDEKAKSILATLFETFLKEPDILKTAGLADVVFSSERDVCDYIAGMTDNYAIYIFKNLFLPRAWQVK